MKTLLLSGLISIATIGQHQAHEMNILDKQYVTQKKEWLDLSKREAEVERGISFYQWKINMLWQQYDLVLDRMQHTKGNIRELRESRDYFLRAYKENIKRDVAVKESEKSIAKLERKFKKAVAEREREDLEKTKRLRVLLKHDLQLERLNFDRMKKRNEKFVNATLLAKLQTVTEHFAAAEKRIEQLEKDKIIRLAADMD